MTPKQTAIIAELAANAPKWAKWLSFDKDGSMTYFSDKPRLIKSGEFWATKSMHSRFEHDCTPRVGFVRSWERSLKKL